MRYVISTRLARRLRDGGVRWTPSSGDRFIVADRDMDEDVFVLADMTVDVQHRPSGQVIGFTGTTEWALDSIEQGQSVWLPSETQLRELLGRTFRRLIRRDGRWRVEIDVNGHPFATEHEDAVEAYGLALLHLVAGDVTAESSS
jgi:hypothetical protein